MSRRTPSATYRPHSHETTHKTCSESAISGSPTRVTAAQPFLDEPPQKCRVLTRDLHGSDQSRLCDGGTVWEPVGND